jgi:hypothetical protein
MASSSSGASGIGVTGLLGVVFVTLKLLGKIEWSWWYVTMPFWIGIVIVFTIILFWLAYEAVKIIINHKWRK